MAKLEIPVVVDISEIESLIDEIKHLQTYKLSYGAEQILVDRDDVVKIFAAHVRANIEQERKKGKWVHGKEIAREYLAGRITHIEYKDYHCSECGYTVENIRWNVDGELVDKYCTVCGAQMEVELNG